jgi:nucleolar GTP-binding protein
MIEKNNKKIKNTIGDRIWDPANIAKRLHVPTYDEILEKIKSRYPRRSRYKSLFEAEMARMQMTYDIIISKTNFIRELLHLLDNLHPFFWELIVIEYDRDEIRKAIRCVAKARRLASSFWEKYRFILMGAESPRELRRIGSEARGRMLSLIKRCRKSLELLRSLVVFLSNLPAVNPELPTVIVAGAPSTGKSTFISQASRARPRVSPFPFTTKSIHIGHLPLDNVTIQLIDTPGLLDRPLEEMNYIERKAIAALRNIQGPVLLLVDVSPAAVLNIKTQFKILNIIKLLNKNIYIMINKIDSADPELLNEAIELAEEARKRELAREVFQGSALNTAEVRNIIRKIAISEGWLQA